MVVSDGAGRAFWLLWSLQGKKIICIVKKGGANLFLFQHFTPGFASLFSKLSVPFPEHKPHYYSYRFSPNHGFGFYSSWSIHMITGQASIALNSSAHHCYSSDRQSKSLWAIRGEVLAAAYLTDHLQERDRLIVSSSNIAAVPSYAGGRDCLDWGDA